MIKTLQKAKYLQKERLFAEAQRLGTEELIGQEENDRTWDRGT